MLADLDKQKTGVEAQLDALKDHEEHLAELEKRARDFVLDLPHWLEGWGKEPDPNPYLYRETYERLGYRVVAHKDGTLDLTFGANGEAHLPPGYRRPEPPPPPPPDDPVWDTWKEGDPIPDPTPGYSGALPNKALRNGTDLCTSGTPTATASS